MTAGHFGLAAIVKARAPTVPLWALMLSTYLLDIIFIVLAAVGVESFAPLDPAHPAYGGVLIHAYYTHSLVGAGLIAAISGWLASRAWGKRAGVVIGAVVFSHWVLDLVVQRPDMPVLPGNLGGLPLLGFGLWQLPVVSAAVELALTLGGAYFYYKSALNAPASAGKKSGPALVAASVTGLFTLMLLAADVFSLSFFIPILLMLLLIIFCGWLDARLTWSLATV